ncbi:MAG: hypothetical protein ALAOOOJD_04739 [bacterium]|nr:hypothetical protein [bacterium]
MVDINLMGDEENREERQPEESFAQTVNLDFGETAEEERAAPFVSEPLPSAYARESREAAMAGSGGYATRPLPMNSNTGASRNKAYLLVAALIVAALIAVYLMIPKAGKPPQTTTDLGNMTAEDSLANMNITLDDSSATAGNQTDLGTTETPADNNLAPVEPATTSESGTETTPLSPSSLASSLYGTTSLGASTVSALGRSFSGGNDFSLISYSGANNSFFVQFAASSAEAIAEAKNAMLRNASPQDLQRKDDGSTNNVVMQGRVSPSAGAMGRAGQRMNFSTFSAWLKKLGADNGLRLTLYKAGEAYSSGGNSRTPVQANFTGDKAGAFDFLNSLANNTPNIATSKIIISSADHRSQSSAKLNVVLLFDFIE